MLVKQWNLVLHKWIKQYFMLFHSLMERIYWWYNRHTAPPSTPSPNGKAYLNYTITYLPQPTCNSSTHYRNAERQCAPRTGQSIYHQIEVHDTIWPTPLLYRNNHWCDYQIRWLAIHHRSAVKLTYCPVRILPIIGLTIHRSISATDSKEVEPIIKNVNAL